MLSNPKIITHFITGIRCISHPRSITHRVMSFLKAQMLSPGVWYTPSYTVLSRFILYVFHFLLIFWCMCSCVFILAVFVCGSSECGMWVGKVPGAVFRAHNQQNKALSWSLAARRHAFPFLVLFAIGCVFLWPTCRSGSCDQSIAVRSNNNADV